MATEPEPKINILVVDDRPENVLALQAVLEELHQNIIAAYSGPEALRCILQNEFAVILLDVNMPEMDGFETAALIRQRQASAGIPIIFITSYGDGLYIERGYALGAVDYILAPPAPDVLRTKVSVFVDLHRKTTKIRRQAERLEQWACQLNKLAAASLAINSAQAADNMLQTVADSARDIIGTHQASILMVPDHNWSHALAVVSLSDKYARWRHAPCRPRNGEAPSLLSPVSKPVRLTQDAMEADPAWLPSRAGRKDPMPLRGLVAAPLTGRDGRSLGIIQLSDRYEGDFEPEDEALLVQLSQMASIAIENAMFAEERETNRIKDEFLSTVSHELRTPLQAMLGWSRVLLSSAALDERTTHGLKIIERNVKVQAKLIEDLLDVARVSSGKLQVDVRPITLSTVVQAAIDTVRPAADEKRVQICVAFEARQDELFGDPGRLQQVAWNLLTNAVKFTPPDGHIDVEITRDGSFLQLRVRDSGQGISPAFLPRVFDRFKQSDSSSTRSQGGLGIGLTIARHIIELHGGTIDADSQGDNQGATFTVVLPSAPIRTQAVQHDPGDANLSLSWNPARLNGIVVLVVEDEPDAREIIANTLQAAGAEVLTATSAHEGLAVFADRRPNVLVSDVAMSGQDGYDFIRAVRALGPDGGGLIPAAALTAYASNEDRVRALSAGFHMHLVKPVEPAALVSAVLHLAGGRSADPTPASPAVAAATP